MTIYLVLATGILCLVMPALGQQQEPATKEEVAEIKGMLEGMSESAAEYRVYVDALRKIKVSGYIQPQFRYTDLVNTAFPIGTFSGGTYPANTKNLFQVRRGRIKVNYDNNLTQFVIQIDAIQTGFTTKDAYVSIVEPWAKSVGLQMGIFNRPFGYEVEYSSSNRESPERSRFTQTLFPGERELGAKLFYAPQMGPLTMLRADIGVFNGSGPTANEFDNFKDVIGHVVYQMPFEQVNAELDIGVSGYFGAVRNNTKFLYRVGDLPSGVKAFVVDSTASNLNDGVGRRYVGFDAQFYYDVPSIGGAILRGEYVFGKQPGTPSTSVSASAQPSTPIYQREFAGWYVYYIQNIGSKEQFVVKYDVFDPNTSVAASQFMNTNTTGAQGLTAIDIKYSTLGFGLIHHWDDNVKLVLYYELVQNEKLTSIADASSSLFPYAADVRDNVLTFRVQCKF